MTGRKPPLYAYIKPMAWDSNLNLAGDVSILKNPNKNKCAYKIGIKKQEA